MVANAYAEVVVAPPTLHAFMLKEKLRKDFSIAAQNCWEKPNGAYTGEISADMLQDMGIPWVIVGHSERRQYCHETDEIIAEKAQYALSKGLKVIICVGENLDIRMAQTQVRHAPPYTRARGQGLPEVDGRMVGLWIVDLDILMALAQMGTKEIRTLCKPIDARMLAGRPL